MTKEEIQAKVLSLSKTHRNLLLSHATGVGKTLSALQIIKHFGGRWYIMVAEIAHINNWHDEIVKHGYEDLFLNIEIFCYDSIHKYQQPVTGIILDEAHHALTNIRLSGISKIKTEHIIGLTASITTVQLSTLEFFFGDFYEDTYTLSQAITDGIIPEPSVYLVGLTLDNTVVDQSYIIKKGLKQHRSVHECRYSDMSAYLIGFPHIELKVNCTARQKYELLNSEFEYAQETYFKARTNHTIRESTKTFLKNRWLNAGSTRKRFLAEYKTSAAARIVHRLYFQKKRFICFTGSIAQAELLSPSTYYIVNSTKDKKDNLFIINRFNNKEINCIFATGMLKEGMNLAGIEAGIIVQLDNQIKSFVQRTGRVLRADDPIVYILYIKSTQDEKYLRTALEGFNEDYICYQTIDEL